MAKKTSKKPPRNGNKQKQKQKQTVIVNINNGKTRAKRQTKKGGHPAVVVAGVQGKIPGRLSILSILRALSALEGQPGRAQETY